MFLFHQSLELQSSLKVYKKLLDPLEAVKISKREDGSYCTISGNEPSSVILYKTGIESHIYFLLKFQEFTLCSLNQRLIFSKGPNNQNTIKKMILNVQYIRNTPNIFTDPKGSKEELNMHYGWMMYGETF